MGIEDARALLKLTIEARLSLALNCWAMFERQVESGVWIAIEGGPDLGFAITNEIQSIRAKLLVFESILDFRGLDKAGLKKIRSFRSSIEGLTRRRNRMVHDPHTVDGHDVLFFRGTAFENNELTRVNMDELSKFSEECIQKGQEFWKMTVDLMTAVGRGPSDKVLQGWKVKYGDGEGV